MVLNLRVQVEEAQMHLVCAFFCLFTLSAQSLHNHPLSFRLELENSGDIK